MKGSFDNNTIDVSLKLTVLNVRADENGLAHQENEDEEFYDCDIVTSNADVTTDHLDDSSQQRRFLLKQYNNVQHKKSQRNFSRCRNQENSALMSRKDNTMNSISFITSESRRVSDETYADSNSNEGKGYENSFDTSSILSCSRGENAAMNGNQCSFDNMSHPDIQSQGTSSTNIDICGNLRRVRSRESFNNVSSLKKSNTGNHFSSNNSTNTLSTASLSASSLLSTDNHNKHNNHQNNHSSDVKFTSQKSYPHNHPVRKRVTNNESQSLCTAPVLTRNNINKHVFSNNSNQFSSTFSSTNDSLSSSSNAKHNLSYNMNSSNEVFSAPEFQHQCFDNDISTNRQEPQPLRIPPMLTKNSFSRRDSFNKMHKSNQLQRKTPTKPSTPSTPRNSATRSPGSNLEPPKSIHNSGSNRRKSNRPFSPSITSPTVSSVSRRHSHPYSKINWNDESEILEKFQLIQDRGALLVPTELLQSRHSFMDKAKVVREWRALYPDEQVDVSHQWSLQKKKLIGDADAAASSDITSPKKLDFDSLSAADIKMYNKTDTTTDSTTNNDEYQATDVDEKDEQQNFVTLDKNKQNIGGADDNLLETKNDDATGNTMESFITCFVNLFGTTGNTIDVTPIVDDANQPSQSTNNITNESKDEQNKHQNQEGKMLRYKQFDECSNFGLVTTITKVDKSNNASIIAKTTAPNKKKLPLKEEPMYSESKKSLGKSIKDSYCDSSSMLFFFR